MSDFFSQASKRARRTLPDAPVPPRPGSPTYQKDAEAYRHSLQHLEASHEAHGDLYQSFKELSQMCPLKKVLGADGRTYWTFGMAAEAADSVGAFPWKVTASGGALSIAGGNSFWVEDTDWSDRIDGYDFTDGWEGAGTGVWLGFEISLNSDADVTSIGIVTKMPSSPLYTASDSYLATQFIRLAEISPEGEVWTQWIAHDPTLIHQNINGYFGWWYV